MTRRGVGVPALLALLGIAASCSATHPTLYPNEQYQKVGSAQADRDVADCETKASQFVKSGGQGSQMTREGVRNTGAGAAVGAASGAVGGAIGGDVGEGAAIGAASGATAGLLGTMFGWMFRSPEPDPTYRNFVETCLRDQGYQPIGWQ
jgi:outer membrane lipoprotein SlyB